PRGTRTGARIPTPLRAPQSGDGAEPPISSTDRASFRRFVFVSRMRRPMSWLVTAAPFSMLAELPMMIASSVAARSALASATSVFSEMSEDITPVLPPDEEHGTARGWQEKTANDQTQVAGIQLGKLWAQARAHLCDLAS